MYTQAPSYFVCLCFNRLNQIQVEPLRHFSGKSDYKCRRGEKYVKGMCAHLHSRRAVPFSQPAQA